MKRPASAQVPSDAEWDYFVERHLYGHILQTRAWGALKSAHGWSAARASATDAQGRLIGAALLLLRDLPYGLGRIAYAPRGPVVDWTDPAQCAVGLGASADAAKRAGAFALVVEPGAPDLPDYRETLTSNGWQELDFHVQPQRTIVVSLAGTEADILGRMKPKTRYNIGLARRKGVTVRPGDARDAAIYHELMRATAERDGFSIHPQAYYTDFLQRLAGDPSGVGALFIAEAERQPLAAVIATALGERATYLYGASSNEKRELMPTYLLQWEAMRWARERGCASYDLWGVPDENEGALEAQFEQRADGLWGVYRFKRGFGGELIRHVGAWVRVLSPARWWLYRIMSDRPAAISSGCHCTPTQKALPGISTASTMPSGARAVTTKGAATRLID
jgi:peptidoglycan pentaglycine glycine transferase (the first glycine)